MYSALGSSSGFPSFSFSVQKEEGLYGAYCQVLWAIYFLLLSVIQPELLLLTVIDEITVKCYNTF